MTKSLNNKISRSEYDVAIIGLGPIGITFANLLAIQGISVLAIDAADEIYNLPRAVGMDHEVMRVFQNIGIAEKLDSFTSDYKTSEYRTAEGEILKRFNSPKEPFPLAWAPYMTFLQPDLEGVLRKFGENQKTLDICVSTELVKLEDIYNKPKLTVKNTKTGEVNHITARFVIGSDGGSSFVRESLKIEFEDLVFDEPWLVIDMLLTTDDVDLPDMNIQYCDPKRPHTFVVGPGNLRRWEFMILPGEDPKTMQKPENIWKFIKPWINETQATIWRSADYRFHALVAKKWRLGNVFLAGDACHMTPPFLAQGMVQGIKDASNLAWKIASVLRGSSDKILDSYEEERRPLVHEVISITKELGRVICERDPTAAKIRNEKMLALFTAGDGDLIRQNLFPPINSGIISLSNSSACVGQPCPQPWILNSTGRHRLDDVLPNGSHLYIGNNFEVNEEIILAAKQAGISVFKLVSSDVQTEENDIKQLAEEHDVFNGWLNENDCNAILVRPDHVVFAGAKTNNEMIKEIKLFSEMIS